MNMIALGNDRQGKFFGGFARCGSMVGMLAIAAGLSGCALKTTAPPASVTGAGIRGNIHGGQQAVVGAHVHLMAASTANYGAASTSLLTSGIDGTDAAGGYVLSGADGGFSITGDYSCTEGTEVYIYSVGGDAGAGANSAAGLLAALGKCPSSHSFASTVPFVWVNEVSTVATAYALSGFASSATRIGSSSTPQSVAGLAAAFATVPQIEDIDTGFARHSTPLGNGDVSYKTVNTLANILASCVNSTGPGSDTCSVLFANARFGGSTGTIATDTATAAIYIAHHPGTNVANLFALGSTTPPFGNAWTSAPDDFTIGIRFTGLSLAAPAGIAIDDSGNIWSPNSAGFSVSELSNTGTPLSPAGGYTGSLDLFLPTAIAIDPSGNIWVVNFDFNSLSEMSNTGFGISGPTGFTGGGTFQPTGLAFDPIGDAWVSNNFARVAEFSGGGTPISPAGGYTGGGLSSSTGVAYDPTNSDCSVWVSNSGNNSASCFSSVGVAGSPSGGFTGGGLATPSAIALDGNGDPWLTNKQGTSSTLTELSRSGAALSPAGGFAGGGLNDPVAIAVDGNGNMWVANQTGNSVSEFSGAGAPLSPATTGFDAGIQNSPSGVGIDFAGNVWISNSAGNSITELVGVAAPTVTPLSVAVAHFAVGTRP